jgi:ABC-2 type transport system ATP-binding protein
MKESIREPILEVTTDDAPKALEALRRVAGVLEVTLYGRRLHVMVEDRDVAEREIPETLAEEGRACHSLRVIAPSLEDVFVSFVRRAGGTVEG